MSTNAQEFLVGEFAEKMAEDVGATADDASGILEFSLKHWIDLGEKATSAFNCSPYLSTLYGSVDKRDIVVEKKERARRSTVNQKSGDATQVKVLGQETATRDGAEKTLTEKLVESTLRQLIREFKNNARNHLCYFRFVINPDDFGQTVENMFYVSFLVKEGRAKIFVDADDGLPKITPVVTKSHSQEEATEKKQIVMSITMKHWEELKTCLGVTKATINHEAVLAANQH